MDNESCIWEQVFKWDGWFWKTDCGNYMNNLIFTPFELGMKYCCFCGDKLEQALQ